MKNMKRIGWVSIIKAWGPGQIIRFDMIREKRSDFHFVTLKKQVKLIPVYIDPKDLRAKKRGGKL